MKNRLFYSLCLILFIVLFNLSSSLSQDATWLTDISHEVGLDSARGSRVLLADVNGDDYPDLLWGSGNINRNHFYLYLNVANPDASSPYKRIFVDYTKESNINANRNPDKTDRIIDVANFVDVDGDGDLDLVTSIYYHRLETYIDALDPGDRSEVLLNDGTGHFTLKEDNGLYQHGLINATGMAFLDYDFDGKLDLYISTWFYDRTNGIGTPDVVFKGNGDGSFTRLYDNSIQSVYQPMYGVNVTDWDNDGWQDVITSPYCNSTGSIFRNMGNGTFMDVASITGYTAQLIGGDNTQALCQWEAQPADFDCDGDMDLLQVLVHGGYDAGEGRTHIAINEGPDKGYSYTWALDRIKRDAPLNSHLGDQGGCWFDLDGDGWLDVAIGQMAYPAPNNQGQERIYICRQNSEHYFDDISKALGIFYSMKEGHSMEPADFDLDGDQDFFCSHQVRDTTYVDSLINGNWQKVQVINVYMKVVLLRNDIGNKNNWVSVKLDAPAGCNKSAVGARITVCSGSHKQISEIQTGLGHFAGEQSFIRNFGLGQLNRIDSVIVRWPMKDSPTTTIYNPPINVILEINRSGDLSFVKKWEVKKPIIAFDKNALFYDTLNIGENKELTFLIKNLGDTALIVSDLEINPAAADVYTIINKQVPFTIEPNASEAVTVKFTPTKRADYNSTIIISSNAQNAPEKSFDLYAYGFEAAPAILSDSLSLTFSSLWADSLEERTFIVKSIGELPLVISNFSFELDDSDIFSIDKSELPIILQPEETKELTIKFQPKEAGDFTSNLLIESDAYNEPVLSINLSGKCLGQPLPEIEVIPFVLFGSVPVGTSGEKILDIKNVGDAEMRVNEIDMSAVQDNIFTIDNLQYPVIVMKDDTLSLKIYFTPKEEKSYRYTIVIHSDASNDTAKSISLRGSGGPPALVSQSEEFQGFSMQVQPNPTETNAKLICNLYGGAPKAVQIEMYNINGMKIKDILSSNLEPGTYTYDLNTGSLAAGMYYITARVDSRFYHVPWIILK